MKIKTIFCLIIIGLLESCQSLRHIEQMENQLYKNSKILGKEKPPVIIKLPADTIYKQRAPLTRDQARKAIAPYLKIMQGEFFGPKLQNIDDKLAVLANNNKQLSDAVTKLSGVVYSQIASDEIKNTDIHMLNILVNRLKNQKDLSDRENRIKTDQLIKLQNLAITKQNLSAAASTRTMNYISAALSVLFLLVALHAFRVRNEFKAVKNNVSALKNKQA